jgi:hypothetical protein
MATVLIDGSPLYDEVARLLDAARDYAAAQKSGPSRRTLDETVAEGWLTVRVIDMTAWVLGRKAVATGEISRAEAHDRFGLSAHTLAFGATSLELGQALPGRLIELIAASAGLEQRILRLDRRADLAHSTAERG